VVGGEAVVVVAVFEVTEVEADEGSEEEGTAEGQATWEEDEVDEGAVKDEGEDDVVKAVIEPVDEVVVEDDEVDDVESVMVVVVVMVTPQVAVLVVQTGAAETKEESSAMKASLAYMWGSILKVSW
jgi:hypothetical protein